MTSSFGTLLVIAITVALMAAAMAKTRHFPGFLAFLASAAVTKESTDPVRRVLATTIIGLEFAFAIATVGGALLAVPIIPLLIVGLFVVVATIFLGVQYVSDEGQPECACFGSVSPSARRGASPEGEAIADVLRPARQGIRNSLLTTAVVLALLVADGSPIRESHYLLLVAGALSPLLIISAFVAISVSSERRKLRLPRHPRYSHFAPRLAPLVVLDYYKKFD